MPNLDIKTSPERLVDAMKLAKKHRISLEDASQIVAQYGSDQKAADKAARRVAA